MIIMIFTWASIIPYQIIITEMFPDILDKFGFDKKTATNDIMKYSQVAVLNVILLPICLMKDLSALSSFNFLGILAIIYLVFVIVG